MLKPKYLTTTQVRALWLRFFQGHDHHLLPPASLVPVKDSSLLFVNSGIATLKRYFTGQATPPARNLVNCQPVIRTNDIDLVGPSRTNNTWFEMLGSFSVGGYFKTTAIKYAWEFLTAPQWLGLDPQQLYVTVFKDDAVTRQAWMQLTTIAADHIIAGGRTTNFWQIGRGPCGPCTEVFYDRGSAYDPHHEGRQLLIANRANDRFLEIWNIVFSEFNYDGQRYVRQPTPNIDTGAGLARISSVMQQRHNTYETDELRTLICAIETFAPRHQYQFGLRPPADDQHPSNGAFRAIADHIRATVMLIKDGVYPTSKERGYVVRRLIRRALSQALHLDITAPFLYRLVAVVVRLMGDFYPALLTKQQLIAQTIRHEEQLFCSLLTRGQLLIADLVTTNHVTARQVFNLHASHGLPLDWLQAALTKQQVRVDWPAVVRLTRAHRHESQQERQQQQGFAASDFAFLKALTLPTKHCYETAVACDTHVTALFTSQQLLTQLCDEPGYVILANTPFFAEQGGQKADTGVISHAHCRLRVVDVQKGPNNVFVHRVQVQGTIKVNDQVRAVVPLAVRTMSARHHTATHLLHAAARHVLGAHAQQVGSSNSAAGLRLDINFQGQLQPSHIQQLQTWVQTAIADDLRCEVINTTYQVAVHTYHAWSLLTNYAAEQMVRVVKFGKRSVELCAGTHCQHTNQVEDFIITKVVSKGQASVRLYGLAGQQLVQQFLAQQHTSWQHIITQLVKALPVKKSAWQGVKQRLQAPPTSGNYHQQRALFFQLKADLQLQLQHQLQAQHQQQLLRSVPAPIMVRAQPLVVRIWPERIDLQQQLNIFQKLQPTHFFCLLTTHESRHHYPFIMGCAQSNLDTHQVFKLLRQTSPLKLKGGGNDKLVRGMIISTEAPKRLQQNLITCLTTILSRQ